MATGKHIIDICFKPEIHKYCDSLTPKMQYSNETFSNFKRKIIESDSLFKTFNELKNQHDIISSLKMEMKKVMYERSKLFHDYKYIFNLFSQCIKDFSLNYDLGNQIQDRRRHIFFDKENLNTLFLINSFHGKHLLYQLNRVNSHPNYFERISFYKCEHFWGTNKIRKIFNSFLTRKDKLCQKWVHLQKGIYVNPNALIVSPFCEHIMHQKRILRLFPRSCLFYAIPIVT